MRAKGDEKERGRRESKRDKERQIERKEKVEVPEERQREKKKNHGIAMPHGRWQMFLIVCCPRHAL